MLTDRKNVKSLLIINYDEHGGCYDHITPPEGATPPSPTTKNKNGFTFDREKVHDNSNVYHDRSDPEYYGNFNISDKDFLQSKITKYGLTFNIGTAYKNKYIMNSSLSLLFISWSVIILFFWVLIVRRNLSVKRLNDKLILKNDFIEKINSFLYQFRERLLVVKT